MAFCVVLVALVNFASARNTSSDSLFGSAASKDDNQLLKNKISIQNERKNNLATAPLSGPGYLADPVSFEEEFFAESEPTYVESAPTIQNQVLLASYNPILAKNTREAQSYQVKTGDTPSLIAAKFGVSTNTILWANNLSETSVIKPGDKLAVLPVTGVKYKVQKSDSLNAIVAKYNADKQKVLVYNNIPADEKLQAGQEIILPDGYISAPVSAPPGTQLATAYGTTGYQARSATATNYYRADSRAGRGHRFPYGYCTWYVAQRKYVPWGGNAGAWLSNARASGKATGRTPQAGAIIVTGESRWGHVGIVEKVSGNTVTISEMNYAGFGRKSTRTINANSRTVKGFIY
ncbi:MAG: LysM peptidoglycan-binding domain-containing protein [Patescibacteria group bacterium]|nr:LysM peptidoglycan-binding domain-containing protein [Patescibacteria group bacterium]